MDVKGAYLNGLLLERVFMKQPDGYSDGTHRICQLIKTLYGLKQAGREWNKVLNTRLQRRGFKSLKSDLCVYVRQNADDLAIITIWVDDLLLFTTSEQTMTNLKTELKSMFDLTDIGEPNKIVGIEINRRDDSIIITQKNYIESILR